MENGYIGKILFIDLESKSVESEPLDAQICRKFLGGYGLGAKILFDRQRPNETDYLLEESN